MDDHDYDQIAVYFENIMSFALDAARKADLWQPGADDADFASELAALEYNIKLIRRTIGLNSNTGKIGKSRQRS